MILIGIGSLLNMGGAVMNAAHLHAAFAVWLISNAICAAYFYGAWRGTWKVESFGERQMLAMYVFFIGTAGMGYLW